MGAEQILFGADYPHGRAGQDDQLYPMMLKAMDELDVPAADKEKIYCLNAKAPEAVEVSTEFNPYPAAAVS